MAEELVTIKTFAFLPQAEVAKLHLDEAGIQAFVADAETGHMLVANTVGFVKLQVPESQAEAALAVLSQRTYDADETGGLSEETRCLSCGTTMSADQSTCPKCGWSYASAAAGNELGDSAQR